MLKFSDLLDGKDRHRSLSEKSKKHEIKEEFEIRHRTQIEPKTNTSIFGEPEPLKFVAGEPETSLNHNFYTPWN